MTCDSEEIGTVAEKVYFEAWLCVCSCVWSPKFVSRKDFGPGLRDTEVEDVDQDE